MSRDANYQIFISYRHVGGDAMGFLLKEQLQAEGYNVFFDTESLTCGKFDDKLLEVIARCETVLPILSKDALDGCFRDDDWMRLELAHAIMCKKNIVPIIMNGFLWPKELPSDIEPIRYHNGVSISFDYFEGVLDKLRRCLIAPNEMPQNVIGLKHVLIWADFPSSVVDKILNRMSLPNDYYVEILEEPMELLSKRLSGINAIVLINTDVTKLAGSDHAIERINEALVAYVNGGGILIATHDIIYRRTRNVGLQQLFGCSITNFRPEENVQYRKEITTSGIAVFNSLPDEFVLHDEEVCWGELAPDVDVFFQTDDGIPLVWGREVGKGYCLWMNSGDFKKYPPPSIARPEPMFVKLLFAALTGDFIVHFAGDNK